MQDVIRHLKALSFDAQAMALLHQLSTERSAQSLPNPKELPPPRNPSRGYWGAMSRAQMEPTVAWLVALMTVNDVTQESIESVRVFLDSRMGEQFALAVIASVRKGAGLGAAVNGVAREWMNRPLDEVARLVYRQDQVSFLAGWIRIMKLPT